MKVRHIIVSLLSAAIVLSCTRESTDKGGTDQTAGIHFATRLDTRSTMLNNVGGLAEAGGFNVWVISHPGKWASTLTSDKTALMNGVAVTSDDNGLTWSYGAAQDWPMDKYVSFFAYGPSTSAIPVAEASDGTPTINFAVDPDVQNQTDLVIATPVKDQTGAAYSYGNPVGIYFQHALSRISFSGLLIDSDDSRKITVKEIELNGLYGSGMTPLTDPAVWTAIGNPVASYKVAVSTGELSNTLLTTDGPKLTTDNGYLLLMPQILARTADDPTMKVILDVDGSEVTYSSLVFSPEEWKPGKSYNYQIAVGKNSLQIIYIDSDIALGEWSPSIVLQTMYLTSSETRDEASLEFAMEALNAANKNSNTHKYSYFGVYGVNDLSHNIEIDVSKLQLDSYASTPVQQYLLFDLKKLIRNWGVDDTNNDAPWTVSVINYESDWDLAPAKQTIPASYNVDGITSATLPATLPVAGGGGATVDVPVSDEINALGSIILKKK